MPDYKRGYLKSKNRGELLAIAKKHNLLNAESLSDEYLIEVLNSPKRYAPILVRKYLANKFGVHRKAFREGNYIKWKSVENTVCTGRFLGIRDDGRIKVAWKWSDKWVKWGTVDPKRVLDFQNRIYHGYSS